eukprot:4743106-Pleurochrysis_carterae.AAC.2
MALADLLAVIASRCCMRPEEKQLSALVQTGCDRGAARVLVQTGTGRRLAFPFELALQISCDFLPEGEMGVWLVVSRGTRRFLLSDLSQSLGRQIAYPSPIRDVTLTEVPSAAIPFDPR